MSSQLYKRKFERRSIYDQDSSQVTIRYQGLSIKTSLYDISPMGAGLFLPQAEVNDTVPKVGTKIVLNFEAGQKKPISAVICHISQVVKSSKKGLKIGVHFLIEESSPTQSLEEYRRRGKLWELPDLFRPLAYAEDQIFFSEYLHFQIIGYSVREVILRTSKSNKGLVPGQKFMLKLLLPDLIDGNVFVRVVRVEDPSFDSKSFTIRAKWIKPNKSLQEALAEFIFLACAGTSMKELIDAGWPAMGLRRAMRLRYAHQEDEFSQVLQLRLKAAQSDGRWLDTTDSKKMIDSYDTHSRHIMCIAGERLVACGRMVFNDNEEKKSEHTGYNVKLPAWLWKGRFVEVSRLCTHPDYRGGDVLLFMIQHLGRIAYSSNSAYMLVNCVDSLVPIYERFGAKNLGLRFDSPFMQGRKLNLLVFDCRKLSIGFGLNPLYYSLGFKRIVQHMDKQDLLGHSPWEKSFRNLMGLFEPLALKMEKRKRRQKISTKAGVSKARKKTKKQSSAA